jgi:hypothetical protein
VISEDLCDLRDAKVGRIKQLLYLFTVRKDYNRVFTRGEHEETLRTEPAKNQRPMPLLILGWI